MTTLFNPKGVAVAIAERFPVGSRVRTPLYRAANRLDPKPSEWTGPIGAEFKRIIRDILTLKRDGVADIFIGSDAEVDWYSNDASNARLLALLQGVRVAGGANDNDFLAGGIMGPDSLNGVELEAVPGSRLREIVGSRLAGANVTVRFYSNRRNERVDLDEEFDPGETICAAVEMDPDSSATRVMERFLFSTFWRQEVATTRSTQAVEVRLSATGDRILSTVHQNAMSVDMFWIGNLPTTESIRNNFRAAYRQLLQAGDPQQEEAAEREKRQEEATRRYDSFRRSLPKEPAMVIADLPIQEHGTRASRRWGIEIETGAGRDLSETPKGWDSKDDGSLESAYGDRWIEPEDCPESDHQGHIWVRREDSGELMEIENPYYEDPDYCDYCGHVEGDWRDADCVELVSPILTSFHSRGLEQICNDLEHAPRTESAGIHVHVEAKDLTPQQIRNLVLIYDRFEPLIESSYDRVERGYCKLRSTRELLSVVRGITPSSNRLTNYGDRYVTVNLWALDAHGTIEFRAMGPRYNYDHLIRWAEFCREIVNAAANGATPKDALKVKNWDGVMDFFRKFGVEINRAEATLQLEPERELVEV